LPFGPAEQPWHSSQYQSLPDVYVQNASLEIAWAQVVFTWGTIAGNVVMPFFTQGYEALDINDARDWWFAEHLLGRSEVRLPPVSRESFAG
jgi:N-acylneuraminate cytidylyltransferase